MKKKIKAKTNKQKKRKKQNKITKQKIAQLLIYFIL